MAYGTPTWICSVVVDEAHYVRASRWYRAAARRGPVVKLPPGKTRITFRIDTDTFNWFREQVHKRGGGGGQTLMNEALRECVGSRERNVEKTVRKVIREELRALKKA